MARTSPQSLILFSEIRERFLSSAWKSEVIATKSESRPAVLTLLFAFVLVLAFALALSLGPLELMRIVIPPANKIVSGPLYDGWLVLAPPLFLIFLFFRSFSKKIIQGHENISSTLNFIKSKLNYPTSIFLSCVILIYVYGLSAYWFATPSGLTIHRNWFMQSSYPWSDVIQRQVSCYRSRKSTNASFVLTFRDGATIDIAKTQQGEFADNFHTLADLTKSAPIVNAVRDPSACPRAVLAFLSQN
jgi:hypothetical protein